MIQKSLIPVETRSPGSELRAFVFAPLVPLYPRVPLVPVPSTRLHSDSALRRTKIGTRWLNSSTVSWLSGRLDPQESHRSSAGPGDPVGQDSFDPLLETKHILVGLDFAAAPDSYREIGPTFVTSTSTSSSNRRGLFASWIQHRIVSIDRALNERKGRGGEAGSTMVSGSSATISRSAPSSGH